MLFLHKDNSYNISYTHFYKIIHLDRVSITLNCYSYAIFWEFNNNARNTIFRKDKTSTFKQFSRWKKKLFPPFMFIIFRLVFAIIISFWMLFPMKIIVDLFFIFWWCITRSSGDKILSLSMTRVSTYNKYVFFE